MFRCRNHNVKVKIKKCFLVSLKNIIRVRQGEFFSFFNFINELGFQCLMNISFNESVNLISILKQLCQTLKF